MSAIAPADASAPSRWNFDSDSEHTLIQFKNSRVFDALFLSELLSFALHIYTEIALLRQKLYQIWSFSAKMNPKVVQDSSKSYIELKAIIEAIPDEATKKAVQAVVDKMYEHQEENDERFDRQEEFLRKLDDRIREQERYTRKNSIIIDNPLWRKESKQRMATRTLEIFEQT